MINKLHNKNFSWNILSINFIFFCILFFCQCLYASEEVCKELNGNWNALTTKCYCDLNNISSVIISSTDRYVNLEIFPFGKCVAEKDFVSEFYTQMSLLPPILIKKDQSPSEEKTSDSSLSSTPSPLDTLCKDFICKEFPLNEEFRKLDQLKSFHQLNKVTTLNGQRAEVYWDTQYFNGKTTDLEPLVSNGKLKRADGSLWDTSHSKNINNYYRTHLGKQLPLTLPVTTVTEKGLSIFVIDNQGNLKISDISKVGKIHHSSLVNGEPVISAGEIAIHQGRITYLNNKSGHYKTPPISLFNTLLILYRKGIALEDTQVQIYYPPSTEVSNDLYSSSYFERSSNPYSILKKNSNSSYSDPDAKMDLMTREKITPIRTDFITQDTITTTGYLFGKESNLRGTVEGISTDWFLFPAENKPYLNWFTNQAIIMDALRHPDIKSDSRTALALAMLQGFNKAAAIQKVEAINNRVQISPFDAESEKISYYRNSSNPTLKKVASDYAKELGLPPICVDLVSGPGFNEVIKRIFFDPSFKGENHVTGIDDLKGLIKTLIKVENKTSPPESIVIDFSKWQQPLYNIIEQINTYLKNKVFMSKVIFISTIKFKEQYLFIHFLIDSNRARCDTYYKNKFDQLQQTSGYRVTQDQLKQAWLKIKSPEEILTAMGLPIAVLPKLTLWGTKIINRNFTLLLSDPLINKFISLGNAHHAPPYLKILPEVTMALLSGLKENQTGSKKTIPQEVLNISLYRIKKAIKTAVSLKNSFVPFLNQIELIHQEIQMILSLTMPHNENIFSNYAIKKLTEGKSPIIPADLEKPQIYPRNSGMHALSSILNGIEKQAHSNELNVAILKNSYYESVNSITQAKSYKTTIIDGENLHEIGKLKKPREETIFNLFLCEFRHNIFEDSNVYSVEKITNHVLEMNSKNMFSEQFSVVIDTTMDFESSEDIKNFLNNKEIKSLIQSGRLNVVFFRSAQKFDMLGMDNYNGGVATTVNSSKDFIDFNTNMQLPEERLTGLSYQGLAHIQKYGGNSTDRYRQLIMDNTQLFYRNLNKNIIYKNDGSYHPISISAVEDLNTVFIHIKIYNQSMVQVFMNRIIGFCRHRNLHFFNRPSFGFVHTNFVRININETPLIRMTLGLESTVDIKQYVQFFNTIQNQIDTFKQKNPSISNEALDKELLDYLVIHNIP